MYTPKAHEESRIDIVHQLIRDYPLGTLVVLGDGELVANAIPFCLDTERGEFGTLVAHVSRANPLWQLPDTNISALIIFHGPQTYISPSWYPSKAEHGKAVPTWNYVVVQAHGKARFIHDRDWLLAHVSELSNTHETGRDNPWRVSDAPEDFIERLLNGIVGIEIPIEKVAGKWKVSKEKSLLDKQGIIKGLAETDNHNELAMANMIKQYVTQE